MVSGDKGCEKDSFKGFFCDLDWVIEYFGVVFFLNLENWLFWNVNEGRFKKNVRIVKRGVKADALVCYIEFSGDNDIAWISAVELVEEKLIFSDRDVFDFGKPFLGFVLESSFQFWIHFLLGKIWNGMYVRYFL